jgi:alanyl-tRNA synthetase
MSDRLYYADPSLAFFEAHVSDIREVSRSQGQSLWQIALDRSAFYPTSGGQPHDTGLLTATSSGGALLEAPILAVEEDDQGEVWHTTPKPLLAGTAVRGYVDWSRRRDHMQQHSGQHLLSAVLYRQLGAPTVSFHLGEMTSTIDLAREGISLEELERVEDTVNEIIAEDRRGHYAHHLAG